MFRESTADVLRWVLHVPLRQPWTDASKSERQIYSLIFPTDFFQAFPKTSCLICITPSYTDCSHPILLCFYQVFLHRHQQGWRSKRAQARICTRTECTETQAQTFPTATSRAMHAHPASGGHTQHPPGTAEGLSGIGRHTIIHTQARRPALSQTHLHTSLYLFPQHTHSGFGAVPLHRLLMLRLKLCSSWKWEGCTGERRRRAGKGFLVIFCLGIFFWQTRIPFELIHFFLPRISNDNA